MTFQLKKINYPFGALEPYIDKETMQIHHTKHHQTYLDKLNEIAKNNDMLADMELIDVLKDLKKFSKDIRKDIQFLAGGVYNHDMFFDLLKKDVVINGEIEELIKNDFGSYEEFVEEFTKYAMMLKGSGWTWLVMTKEGYLEIINLKNQHNPISKGYKPLLGLDMWEHSYYLKHQNKKAEYIKDFFKVIDWNKINEML